MHYVTEADGVGPSYCKHCRAKPNVSTQCNDCPKPEVWPENVTAVRLYHATQTQWKRTLDGKKLVGLDYAGVRAAMEMMGIEDQADTLERLQRMEVETINVINTPDQ